MLHGALEVEKSTLPELFLLPEGRKYLHFGSSEHPPKPYGIRARRHLQKSTFW
jgi:hypothetical protein